MRRINRRSASAAPPIRVNKKEKNMAPQPSNHPDLLQESISAFLDRQPLIETLLQGGSLSVDKLIEDWHAELHKVGDTATLGTLRAAAAELDWPAVECPAGTAPHLELAAAVRQMKADKSSHRLDHHNRYIIDLSCPDGNRLRALFRGGKVDALTGGERACFLFDRDYAVHTRLFPPVAPGNSAFAFALPPKNAAPELFDNSISRALLYLPSTYPGGFRATWAGPHALLLQPLPGLVKSQLDWIIAGPPMATRYSPAGAPDRWPTGALSNAAMAWEYVALIASGEPKRASDVIAAARARGFDRVGVVYTNASHVSGWQEFLTARLKKVARLDVLVDHELGIAPDVVTGGVR